MNIQLKKGALELCVVSILSKKDYYGYELVKELHKHIDVTEGAIYPLVKRLEKEGYLISYLSQSKEGPVRKCYSMTTEGEKREAILKQDWIEFCKGINSIVCEGVDGSE